MGINNRNLFKNKGFACLLILALITLAITGCNKTYTPKPRSYFRIDFPEKKYILFESDCNFSFEIPVYANIVPYQGANPEPCWMNIDFPGYKGTIHLTYKELHQDLNRYVEDIYTLAYKHIIKADDIVELPFSFPERKVYGMIYDIKGNTASSRNFYATDSSHNFLSGALYFNVIPNKDSLAPVVSFFAADIEHLIETLNWK